MKTKAKSNEELMEATLQGDRQAYRSLVQRWKRPLIHYFYRQVWQSETAEDLAQEVFLKVWKSKHYHTKGSFSAWIFSIARNTLIDYKRKRKEAVLSPKQEYLMGQVPSQSNPESLLMGNEKVESLSEALDQLSNDQRSLLLMAKYEGMKYKELAQVFQTTESNIKVKVFRSLKRLKTLMKAGENQ